MKRIPVPLLVFLLGLCLAPRLPAQEPAEHHRATRLGAPSTRFAPPLQTPEDLRSRFRDENLKPDFAEILRQWGWTGNLDDLHHAAQTAEIVDVNIAVGETMPFMSSRRNGKPICLRNVLWAGEKPAPAYAFHFVSKGRRYRCVTPKACSNFFLEDHGPEPVPALAIDCAVPAEVPLGRVVEVCLVVRNTGTGPESNAVVRLAVPPGAVVRSHGEGGRVADGAVTWELRDFAANAGYKLCATLAVRELGELPFTATAGGTRAPSVQTACSTKIIGVPAILLEVVDLEDPVEIGKEATYEIRVTNQGTAPGTNVRIVCKLPPSQEFVSASGDTTAGVQERVVTTELLPTLAPKAVAKWRVVVKALEADDVRFKVELSSDQFQQPIREDEATQQY